MGDATPTCGDSGGINKAGAPCRVTLNLDAASGLCVMHDPARLAARDAMRGAGGRAATALRKGRVPKAPQTLEDAEQFLSWLPRAVCVGSLGAKEGHVAVAALKEFCSAFSKRALEQQVRALRAELAEAKRKSQR